MQAREASCIADSADEGSSSEESDAGEYEVQALLAHRRCAGTLQYKVRWRGYGVDEDTWEPASHLCGSRLLVSKYNALHGIGSADEEEETADDDEEEAGNGDNEEEDNHDDGVDKYEESEDESDENEDKTGANDGCQKNMRSPDAHAKSLVGKWLNYLFLDTFVGVEEPVPRWYNCKVVGAGAPAKKLRQKGKKRRSATEWQDWVNAEFEDGEIMHLLVSPSKEGEVWRRGKVRTKPQQMCGARSMKTAANQSRCTTAADAVERKLRQLMSKDGVADIAPVKDGFHPVYNPCADRRKSSAAARIDWEQMARAIGGEMSGRALMRLWTNMQEREAPDVSPATIAALGLHPLGDAKAALGATLPLTCAEAHIVHASQDPDNEQLLVDAANASGACPSCLRQLLLHAGAPQTLCWMLTRTHTPGECIVCKRDTTTPHKPAQGKISTKHRSKSQPVVNGDKIEHRFQWQGTRWKWYSGQVHSRAQWGGWFNVEFEDGETLAVNLTRANEGTVWRHHSMPALITLPSDAAATYIRAAIKAAAKAMEKFTEQAAEEQKQRQLRCRARSQLQMAADTAPDIAILYPQLAPGFSGNAAGYWTPDEDKKLMQCIARHTPSSVPHPKRWGWKETSSLVGHSTKSCRRRAELLDDFAGLKTAIMRPLKGNAGIDMTRKPPVETSWNPILDAKLRSAAAMHVVMQNDQPGKHGGSSTQLIQGWNEIAQLVGKSLPSCRHRLQSLFMASASGAGNGKFACTLCGAGFKTFRSLLLHNSHGSNRDCAATRGYWLCETCCRPFHHKAAFVIHARSCTGLAPTSKQPPRPEQQQEQEQEQKIKNSRALAGLKTSSAGLATADQSPAALRVVSSSFFSSKQVEQKMRKRTWQSCTSEEPRLSKWPTSRIPIAVRDTQTVKGFGAFASRDIRANEMLGEYAGEIIDAAELRKRQKSRDDAMEQQKPEPPPDMIKGMSAAAKAATVAGPAKRKRGESALTDEELAARMSGRHYVFDLGCGLSVDASHVGNSTRYLNHASAGSSKANVRAQITNHYGIRKVVLYACRDIKASEELCYDYGEGFKRDCGIELI